MLFSQSDFKSGFTLFVSMCVSSELNPQPFALLTQCSTTEPQEHNTNLIQFEIKNAAIFGFLYQNI